MNHQITLSDSYSYHKIFTKYFPTVLIIIIALLTFGSKLAFTAQGQEDIFFLLIDTSQSMNQRMSGGNTSRMESVKTSLMDFCGRIPPDSQVWLYTFDNGIRKKLEAVPMADNASRQNLIQFIKDIEGTGKVTYAWSSLDEVLSKASTLVEKQTSQVHLLVYSDGKDEQKDGSPLADVLAKYQNQIKTKAINGSYITVGFELDKPVVSTLTEGGFEVLAAFDPEALTPLKVMFGWAPERPLKNQQIQFFDRSLGMISGWEWDFGDQSRKSDEKAPVHQYAQPGDYVVTLTIRGLRGRNNTFSQPLTITEGEKPRASFEVGTDRPVADTEIKFTDMSKGLVTSASWDFGDGSQKVVKDYSQSNTSRSVTHRFEKKGEYQVRLTAIGPDGQGEQTVSLAVGEPQTPEPLFDFQLLGQRAEAKTPSGTPELTVRFDDKSSGLIRKRLWDFGDGTNREEQTSFPSIEHTFSPGDFKVTLIVQGDNEEFSMQKLVSIPPPLTPLERYRIFIIAGALIFSGLLTVVSLRWYRITKERKKRRFSGTMSWSRDGKKWNDEPIAKMCESYEMPLNEGLHGIAGVAVITKDMMDSFEEKYLVVVKRNKHMEESDSLDAIGSPSRKLHGLKFSFTKL
jgi:PKD repeat protein